MLAAVLGTVGALAPLRLLGQELISAYGVDLGVGTYVAIAVTLMAVPTVLTAAFAAGALSQRWASAAVATFVAAALFGGWGVFFLGYLAALILGMAIAAGAPLPPVDPADDRLHRPMPRRDDAR